MARIAIKAKTAKQAPAKGKAAPKPMTKKANVLQVAKSDHWVVVQGDVVPATRDAERPKVGRPRKLTSLFRVVAEKIPYEFLAEVQRSMKAAGRPAKPGGIHRPRLHGLPTVRRPGKHL